MKIAFVIPWYGDIPGGAESACKKTAENLQNSGVEVEVLTTCVREFLSDWNEDYYKEGIYDVDGVIVRRFKVRRRDSRLFDKINYKLMHNQKISHHEEVQFITEMVNSDDLYKYISENKSRYDCIIFIPYMFGTTYFGSKACPEKAILIPCLHDESYAYMNIYQDIFNSAKGLIFLSEPELKLADKIFRLNDKKKAVLGVGIDTDIKCDAVRFRDKYNIKNKFILYAGRRETGKNIHMLLDYFYRYRQGNNSDAKMVLIGSGKVNIPRSCKGDVIDLGFIPKQDKYDAFAASTVLCQPSVNESFSIVIMESWLCGTPVLVNADCAVTKDHCIKCNGGLYFENYDEFEACLNFYFNNSKLAEKMGENGRKYVLNEYNWDKIIDKFKKFLLIA